jgi:hypothetical protein
MKISADLIKKDKELDSEYAHIINDFKLMKISEFDYVKKLKELHIRLLVHEAEIKKYNDSNPELTKISVLTQRLEFIKQQIRKIQDKFFPRTEEQKRIEEGISQVVDNQINEHVIDVYTSENDGRRQFGLKLSSGDSEYVDFDNQRIPLDFSSNSFTILKDLVSKNSEILKKWVNDYKENGRDYYFFLYDLPTLAKFLSELPMQFNKLKKLKGDHEELLHNRMIAQLAVQYQNQGCNIDLEVTNDRGVPDLHINGNDLDIKTIVTPAINHPDHFVRFSKSVRNRFSDAIKQIHIETDMIAIAPWSQIMNNTLKEYYRGMFVTKLPTFEGGKTILVLEGEKPYEDYYYIIPSDQICDDIRNFAENGYQRISDLSYLGSIRRNGYAVTRSGSPRLGFGMNFTIN